MRCLNHLKHMTDNEGDCDTSNKIIDRYFTENPKSWDMLNVHRPQIFRYYNNLMKYLTADDPLFCDGILDIIIKYTYPEWYVHGLNIWAKHAKFDKQMNPYCSY